MTRTRPVIYIQYGAGLHLGATTKCGKRLKFLKDGTKRKLGRYSYAERPDKSTK
ncbi:MAG: hypothetical protein U0V04_04805 [Spirosomataceae bacterium]